MEQPITALQTPDCNWLLHWFIEVNFSKLGLDLNAFLYVSHSFFNHEQKMGRKGARLVAKNLHNYAGYNLESIFFDQCVWDTILRNKFEAIFDFCFTFYIFLYYLIF